MVIASRRERIYNQFPEPVSGYELSPEHGYFSVIIPEATTNLVTNPRREGGVTTGYTTLAGTMTDVTIWQANGGHGLRLLPAVATESGFYYDGVALAAGTTYTASVTIQGEEGKIYYIWFASQAGALLGTKRKWISDGHKQRIWVTYPETAALTRRIYVTRDAQYSDQNVFYADGLQVEAKSYPTTYCDGDLKGFVLGEVAYQWNGTPQASTSTRSAQTRSGGREMNLLDLGIRVLAILGLGMSPLVDQALPMPGRGELAQGTGTQAREFTLVSAIYAEGSAGRHLQALRSGLIDAFKPDLVTSEQPIILRYQACDEEGDPLGESLDIICKYQSGLEGNWDNHQQERLAINFKMHLPWIQNTYTTAVNLGYQTAIANANYILKRATDGIWSAPPITAGINLYVRSFAIGNDGSLFVGGAFTNVGDANGDYIVKWNGTAWSSLGSGVNGLVSAMAVDANGNLYVGGNFPLAGGIANTVRIAKWDGANWTALGTGMDDSVNALAIGPDGKLYAGGAFHSAGGIANTQHIALWDGATWVSLSSGSNGDVVALAFDKTGNLYVGGAFTIMGGDAHNRIARWNGVTWSALGTGMSGDVNALIVAPDGTLYAGGSFSNAGGYPGTANIAKWNGQFWRNLGAGTSGAVYALTIGPDKNLYASGYFLIAGDVPLPDCMAMWNGSIWTPLDINLAGNSIIYALIFDRPGNLYIGTESNGTAYSATVTVPTVGSSTAYPIFYLTGPGTIWQIKNYTTGKAIFLDLTLLAGERAILDLNPTNPTFISTFRGNIWNSHTILEGSNLNFPLMPGDNNISAYFFGSTTAATAILMLWRDQYWSLDGAIWK